MARRDWRKLIKKLQRKRRRQKAAKELAEKLNEDELLRQNDPEYQQKLKEEAQLEELQRQAEERQHQEDEEEWMRRELIAQQQFQREMKIKLAKEAEEQAKREQEHKALAKLEEERQRKLDESNAEFERTMQQVYDYLNDPDALTPKDLKIFVESRPGAKICEFYAKTNCCRFGNACSCNHKRPILSTILLLHHLYVHPLLDDINYQESCALELDEHDIREDYDEFFVDILEELEKYGTIINFRTVRNTSSYMRGNVFVEYESKRAALKAFTALQGRFYAGRRLDVEFSNLVTWRGAICGLSLTRKCPRGLKCAYLHIFKNPGDKYNNWQDSTMIPPSSVHSATQRVQQTPLLSWDDVGKATERKNWRWSESPEVELRPNSSSNKNCDKSLKKKKENSFDTKTPDNHSNKKKEENRDSTMEEDEVNHSEHRRRSRKEEKHHKSKRQNSSSRTKKKERSWSRSPSSSSRLRSNNSSRSSRHSRRTSPKKRKRHKSPS